MLQLRFNSAISRDPLNLGKLPLSVAQRAHTSGAQPALDAIQMKHVRTVAKSNA